MSISIASNIASLKAQTNLRTTTNELSKTFEKLSSGLRINSASDDPAGLALADGLRADTKLAAVAFRNASDGISQVSLAESALTETYNILTRMAELAQQSSNGVYTNSQRSALQSEFVALGSEIDRIASTTKFNSVGLLSSSSDLTLQVGLDGGASSRITLASVVGTLDSVGLAASGQSRLTFSLIDTTTTGAQSAAYNALSAVTTALTTIGTRRGTLGAHASRLNSVVNLLQVQRENLSAAESRIRDVDIAEETAKLVRLQVLQQAATAVLAQANQQPNVALSLLR